jgi:hypothetical protein
VNRGMSCRRNELLLLVVFLNWGLGVMSLMTLNDIIAIAFN